LCNGDIVTGERDDAHSVRQRLQIEDDATTNYSIVTEAESAPGSVSMPVSSRLVPVARLTDETQCQTGRDLISDVIVNTSQLLCRQGSELRVLATRLVD